MHDFENKGTPAGDGAMDADAKAKADAKRLEARRQFLRIGLVTGPVVLTLASRPAFGGNKGGTTTGGTTGTTGGVGTGPSVGMSGNVSTYGPNVWARLQGLTPGFWKQVQHKCYWAPNPLKPNEYKYGDKKEVKEGKSTKTVYVNGTKFKDVFSNSTLDSSLTMLDVLNLGGGGANALGRHAVAALLNANHPQIFYRFSVESVIGMVNAAFSGSNTEELKNLLDSENNREGVGFGSCS